MIWVNIIAILILIFSFIGGLKEGAVKQFANLLALFIAIPLAGLSYHLLSTVLAFLPGTNWENFFGFFITLAIFSALLQLLFLLPRKIAQKIWKKGMLFRLLGGGLNILNTGMSMVVFALALGTYPIIDWLARVVVNAGMVTWLVNTLGFVQALLPEEFHGAAALILIGIGG